MTVCIAAICDAHHLNGPFVIAAADRMITIGDLEYEPNQTKTVHLASQTIGLFAGDMQLHAAVVPKVIKRTNEVIIEEGNINVSQIADFYAEEFAYYRRVIAEREILFPMGLNLDRFLSRQTTMAHYQVDEISNRLRSYHINSSAVIAGIDPTGGHLYRIEDPGVSYCHDTPFFACIGSGEHLATTQFVLSKFDKNWEFPSALWLTFSAKARAEAAGGVGQQTDLVYISRAAKIQPLTGDQKELLYSLFKETNEAERSAFMRAASGVADYIKSLTLPLQDTTTTQTSADIPTEPSSQEKLTPNVEEDR